MSENELAEKAANQMLEMFANLGKGIKLLMDQTAKLERKVLELELRLDSFEAQRDS